MSLKIAKNGLTQWFLESFYAAVLVFWCLIMIRWNKSFISLFCQNGGLASARLNPAWTEPSNNPQRLPSSFNITKYHQNTPRLSLRHPKTSPNSIRHYRHHRISSKTFKVVYLVHHIQGILISTKLTIQFKPDMFPILVHLDPSNIQLRCLNSCTAFRRIQL